MKSIDAQFKEKILSMDSSELRSKFFRPDEGIRVYHVSRSTLMKWAEDADAMYCTGKMCLIEKDKFEKYFEQFKVTRNMENMQ